MPFQPEELTEATLKGFVDRLHRFCKTTPATDWPPKRAWAQEAMARALGFPNFHAAQQSLARPKHKLTQAIAEPKSHWEWPTPDGVAGMSENLLSGYMNREGRSMLSLPLSTKDNLLLLGTDQERDAALGALVQATAPSSAPLLWIRGEEALSNDDHHLKAVRLSAFQGYSATIEHVLHDKSASEITELLVLLMDQVTEENSIWKGRAVSLISSVVFALVYLRDHEGLELKLDTIRDHLILENFQKLADRHDFPLNILQPIRTHLRSLPGYQEKALNQSETVMDQHGFLQMQFTKILGMASINRFPLDSRMIVRLDRERPQSQVLASLVDEWARRHPKGFIVVDGVESSSFAYFWFLKSSPQLKKQHQRVIWAMQNLNFLPSGDLGQQLFHRIQSWVVMGHSNTAVQNAVALQTLQSRGSNVVFQA